MMTTPDNAPKVPKDQEKYVEYLLEAWKQVIDVQKHFNELSLKVRNFLITLIGGVLGILVLFYKEGTVFTIAIGLGVAAVLLIAMFIMDRLWYHKLLRGAVDQGEKIEKELESYIPNIGLTLKVSEVSRKGSWPFKNLKASGRVDIIYGLILLGLIGVGIGLMNGKSWNQNHPSEEKENKTTLAGVVELKGDSVTAEKYEELLLKLEMLEVINKRVDSLLVLERGE